MIGQQRIQEQVQQLDAQLAKLGLERHVLRVRATAFDAALDAVRKESEPTRLRLVLLERDLEDLQRTRQELSEAAGKAPPDTPPKELEPTEEAPTDEPPDTPE